MSLGVGCFTLDLSEKAKKREVLDVLKITVFSHCYHTFSLDSSLSNNVFQIRHVEKRRNTRHFENIKNDTGIKKQEIWVNTLN